MSQHSSTIRADQIRMAITSPLFSNEKGELDVDLSKPFHQFIRLILWMFIVELGLMMILTILMIIFVIVSIMI